MPWRPNVRTDSITLVATFYSAPSTTQHIHTIGSCTMYMKASTNNYIISHNYLIYVNETIIAKTFP